MNRDNNGWQVSHQNFLVIVFILQRRPIESSFEELKKAQWRHESAESRQEGIEDHGVSVDWEGEALDQLGNRSRKDFSSSKSNSKFTEGLWQVIKQKIERPYDHIPGTRVETR